MTLEVRRYELDFEKTLPYFIDHIQCGKEFSEVVISKIDFTKGCFFTILPNKIDLSKLYKFSCGGIVFPSSCEEIDGCNINIINVHYECSSFMFDFLRKGKLAFVENYMLTPGSPFVDIKNVRSIYFESDVHYILDKMNSIQEIYETIRKSTEVWHFLAVLANINDFTDAFLTKEMMFYICEQAEFVITVAYDEEGYVFWEKM